MIEDNGDPLNPASMAFIGERGAAAEEAPDDAGPWELDQDTGEIVCLGSADAPVVLGGLYGFESPCGVDAGVLATGKRIVAVPEMVDALILALPALDWSATHSGNSLNAAEAAQVVRAALSKAGVRA